MAGAYVESSRLLPPVQENIPYLDPKTSLVIPGTLRQGYFAPGGAFQPVSAPDLRQYQRTYSYRSVGSPLGPSEYEALIHEAYGRKAAPTDTGHTFETEKIQYFASHPSMRYVTSNYLGSTGFEGIVIPEAVTNPSNPSYNMDFPALPGFDPNFVGNKLLKKAAPTAPGATLLQTGAEILREGITLPGKASLALLHDHTQLAKAAGSEYLNVAFGWLPLMSDLTNMLQSVINSYAIISQLHSDSGQSVRRSRGVPLSSTVETINGRARLTLGGFHLDGSAQVSPDWPYPLPWWWDNVQDNSGTPGTITKQTSEEIWFEGSFSYYLNPGQDLVSRLERYSQYASKLLGLRLTPAVLWELAPWSWLVDYFIDIGSALETVSLFQEDGLVLEYGYLMRKTTQRVTLTSTKKLKGRTPEEFVFSKLRTSKERFRSTPFGFGFNLSGLTDRQWTILAALGLTRGPRSF